jgi:hypothetical protein
VFHLEDVFVVGSGLKVDEEHREGELCAMFQMLVTWWPSFSISDLMSSVGMEWCIFFRTTLYERSSLGLYVWNSVCLAVRALVMVL